MTIADVLAALVGLALLCGGLAALAVLLQTLFPDTITRAADHAGNRPVRMGVLGGFSFFLFFISIILFGKVPGIGHLLALLTLLTGLSIAMLGGAGVIRRLSEKLPQNQHSNGFIGLLQSAAILELTFLIPLVGWFIVLPITFAVMLGTGLRTLFHLPRVFRQTVPVAPQPVQPFHVQA